MRHTDWFAALILIAAPGACGSETVSPGEDPSTMVTPREQWCGGLVELQASRYRSLTPRFAVEGEVLQQRRVDSITFEIRLPRARCGTLTIFESSSTGHFESLTVLAHGLEEAFTVRPGLIWGITSWPKGGQASVLGATEWGVGILHPASRSVTEFRGIHDGWGGWGLMRSVGLSYDPTKVFLIDPVGGLFREWQLLPFPVPGDTAPSVGSLWHFLEMAPGSWLRTYHHDVVTSQTNVRIEETQSTLLSPDGRLATVRANVTWDGLPVFEAQTGAIGYRVPEIRGSVGADFSTDGRYLYVAGRDQNRASIVAKVDATDGGVTYIQQLGEYVAVATLVDPFASLLYLAVTPPWDPFEPELPTILVYDAERGIRVATLETPEPDASPCPGGCYGGVLVHDPFVDELYFVVAHNTVETTVFRYTLPQNRDELLAASATARNR